MPRNLINLAAFRSAIEEALGECPPAIQDHKPALRSYLMQAATTHESVRIAHRRKNDPDWAIRAFDEGRTLYRFQDDEKHRESLTRDIRHQLSQLEEVAKLARGQQGFGVHDAAAFLRGLSHNRDDLGTLGHSARQLVRQAQTTSMRARRHEVVRTPVRVEVGTLIGERCVSLGDVMRTGRRAQNCLADRGITYWEGFLAGHWDFWELRLRDGDRRDRLIVLKVDRQANLVTEALGARNGTIGVFDVGAVAQFCQAAGLTIGHGCRGLLPDFMAPPVIEPRVVDLEDDQCAIYCEWPTAVRIDLSTRDDRPFRRRRGATEMLLLTFDPSRPIAAALLDGPDPRADIASFGKKRLRRIVRSLTLDQTRLTRVQQILLVLAA